MSRIIVSLFILTSIVVALITVVASAVDDAGGMVRPYVPSGAGRPGQVHAMSGGPQDFTRPTGSRVGAQSVLGNDERIRITETDNWPFSAVTYLGIYLYPWSEVPDADCSGTLVGPDVILTAAHCLYDPESGWVANVVAVPGYDSGYEPFGFQFAENVWVPDNWILSDGDPLWDWGIVKLPNSELADEAGWMRVLLATTQTLQHAEFFPVIAGYPGDKPLGEMWAGVQNSFLNVFPAYLNYSVDTWWGQSGSAIWSLNTDEWFFGYVVGVHVRTEFTHNVGSRIDGFIIDDLILACDQMGCQIDLWEETAAPTSTPTLRPPSATPPTIAVGTATPTKTPVATVIPTNTPVATATGGPTESEYRIVVPGTVRQ
ncbi:MAG: trypsin-like serine peptidase [Tepidiformaceae bacterium]